MRNVEIKARVHEPEALGARAAALADAPPAVIVQRDTFFHAPCGRLKLRDFGDGSGELIHYERADTPEPTESDYRIVPTSDPTGLRAALAGALGVRGEVRKRRTLYRVGRTRIHLDEVDGLGVFVELEVVLAEGESVEAGTAEARDLLAKLDVSDEARLAEAYIDML